MRAALLVAGLLMAGSCGGSSSSPTAPGPVPAVPPAAAIALDSGPYTLAIAVSTSGTTTCQNGVCFSISLCIGNPSPTTVLFDVMVERSGDTATVRAPGGASPLVLNLTVSTGSVTGTISGSARDTHGLMVVATAGTISGAASFDPAYALSGTVQGQISVDGGSCSNNGHAWSLAHR